MARANSSLACRLAHGGQHKDFKRIDHTGAQALYTRQSSVRSGHGSTRSRRGRRLVGERRVFTGQSYPWDTAGRGRPTSRPVSLHAPPALVANRPAGLRRRHRLTVLFLVFFRQRTTNATKPAQLLAAVQSQQNLLHHPGIRLLDQHLDERVK